MIGDVGCDAASAAFQASMRWVAAKEDRDPDQSANEHPPLPRAAQHNVGSGRPVARIWLLVGRWLLRWPFAYHSNEQARGPQVPRLAKIKELPVGSSCR
jgi:hypothetical protein